MEVVLLRQRELYVEEELQLHFAGMIAFVLEAERKLAHHIPTAGGTGGGSGSGIEESKVEGLVSPSES